MGAALSFLGQKLFASSTLINAKCENISCCASVAAVQSPVIRRVEGQQVSLIHNDGKVTPSGHLLAKQ